MIKGVNREQIFKDGKLNLIEGEEIFNYLYDPVTLFNDSNTIYILFGGISIIKGGTNYGNKYNYLWIRHSRRT